jgi:hypothetical protein
VFIVGCGRSGTTLIGELLAAHPDVAYLNEPRKLWGVDPRTRVLLEGPGRLVLTATDLIPEFAEAQRRQMVEAVDAAGRRRLVEKTPVNSFRIGYLDALCPDARFVHIIRDGRDVAASIARLAAPPSGGSHRIRPAARFRRRSPRPAGAWYGEADSKWRRLRSLAETEGIAGIDEWEDDLTARGLLEWRLAVTFARRSLHGLDPRRWLELRYEDVLREPRKTMATVLEGTGLDGGAVVLESAERQVRDPHHRREVLLTVAQARIAGDLLAALGYRDG